MLLGSFFADIPNNQRVDTLNLLSMFFVGTALTWVLVNVNTASQSASNAAIAYAILLTVWGFALLAELASKKGDFIVDVYGMGKNYVMAFMVGVGTAVLLSHGANFIAIPQAATPLSNSTLQAFFVLAAAVVEANFFRGLLFPGIIVYLERFSHVFNRDTAGVIALFIQAGAFAAFHLFVRGGSVSAVVPSFIFAIVAGLGVLYFRSIAYEYGLHLTNNALYLLANGV